MGEVRNGEKKGLKYFYSEIFYGGPINIFVLEVRGTSLFKTLVYRPST